MNNNFENGTINSIFDEKATFGDSFYKSLFKNNRNPMLLINIKTSAIEDCNLSACSFYGYSYEEMLRLKISDINAYSEDEIAKEIQLAKNEQRNNSYFKHRKSNGRICYVAVNSTPITLNNESYLFSIIVDASKGILYEENIDQYHSELEKHVVERTHDIIESNKILEKGIEESEERFRATFEQAAVGICHTSLDGRFLRVNKKACEIIGYTNEELLQMKFQDVSFTEDLQVSMELKRNLLDSRIQSHSFEKRYIRKDGVVVWLFLTISLMYDINAQPIRIITVIQDITEKKKMERALTESQTYINTLVESTSDYVWTVDSIEFKLKTYNAAFNNYYKSICGTNDNIPIGASMFLDLSRDEEVKFYKRAVLEGAYQLEYETKDKAQTFLILINPLINNGEVFGVSVIAKDITERKKMSEELLRQKEQLINLGNKKNEALEKALGMQEEFFANISHELKTPLNVIFATSQLLNMYCNNGSLEDRKDSIIKHIDSIKQNSNRLSKLINNIVDLSKIEAGYYDLNLTNNNIVEIVEEIVMSVSNFTKIKGLNIIFDTDTEEKIIACDPEKIERIVLNLISNAIKFSDEGGEIFVDFKENNEFVEISVKDNGIGIEENHQQMIFDRYKQVDKSLSRNAEGTGIGLSLVKSIVELHGGYIYVESKYGNGSRFTVMLPNRKIMQENIVRCNMMRNNAEIIQVELSDICS